MMNRRRFFLGAAARMLNAMLPPAPTTFDIAYTDALLQSWMQTKEMAAARMLNAMTGDFTTGSLRFLVHVGPEWRDVVGLVGQ